MPISPIKNSQIFANFQGILVKKAPQELFLIGYRQYSYELIHFGSSKIMCFNKDFNKTLFFDLNSPYLILTYLYI